MGNARLVKEGKNTVLDLNGHDQWVEVYRADNVELNSNELTLTCRILPRKLVSSCGSFITKGNYQFGLQQRGKDKLEFYIYTDKKHSVCASLPTDWEYNWHQVTCVYDGQKMSIYIDGAEKPPHKHRAISGTSPTPSTSVGMQKHTAKRLRSTSAMLKWAKSAFSPRH